MTNTNSFNAIIHVAHVEVIAGLIEKIQLLDYEKRERLLSMVHVISSDGNEWPSDKLGRWVGFIQGILYSEGLLDVNEERDRTREIFHEAYLQCGYYIPPSIDVSKDSDDQQ